VFPGLVHDADTHQALPERHAREGLGEDVVREHEDDDHEQRVTLDFDSGVRVAGTTHDIGSAGHEPEDDPEREEDENGVEQDGDEAECHSRVVEALPPRRPVPHLIRRRGANGLRKDA
jgi:hypothetical protein